MNISDAGHWYQLTNLDIGENGIYPAYQDLVFVKRNNPSDKYPGNENAYAGTTIQEVCRALIDRCKYVNKQIWCSETEISIRHLRAVILELETRAAKRHGRKILPMVDIENEPTCKLCGHIQCNETCRQKSQSVHKHTHGGSDYLHCDDCGQEWDYRKPGAEPPICSNYMSFRKE